ncbi:MAG: apolipoprotein N-acyltransferase [Gammaproteobacteria bacterium]|nr:apolipoprotein N-acyltransferase [Gammaproteobacteria bacterium]
MHLVPKLKLLLMLAAGGLLPFSYAPFGLFWVAPISFAALMVAWRGATPGSAFRLGFAFGAASFLGGIHWVYVSIHDFGPAHAALAAFLTISLVAVLALFVAITGWLAARWFTIDGPRAWLGVFPALWVLTEWWRGWFLSGLGWLAAGYSQTDSWLMGYAALGGVHLMSWAVLVTAGALVTLSLGPTHMRGVAIVVMLSLWIGGYQAGGVRWTQPKGTLLTVALVQGAVPQELKWQPSQFVPTLDLYRDLTYQSEGSQLIVWPEAAIPALYGRVVDFLAETERWAEQHGSTVLLGILRNSPESQSAQNALVALVDPPMFYVKRHLVPYGEYFPVPGFVRGWLKSMSLPYRDVVPGAPGQPPLDVAGEKIAVTICYEDVFGAEQLHYFPEATLLVNISNDAWFGDTIAPHQHLQISRVRAAEVGRYVLRATNTGVSAIIDPYGRVVSRSPQFEPHVLKGVVQGFTGATPYARWGNYAVIIGALIILLLHLPVTKFTIRPWT